MFSFDVTEISKTDYEYSSFLQSHFWLSFKKMHGWSFYTFDVKVFFEKKLLTSFCISVMNRRLLRFFSICYIPMMLPPLDSEYSEHYDSYISEFSKTLKQFLPRSTICIRYDLPNNFYSLEEKNIFLDKLLKSSRKME